MNVPSTWDDIKLLNGFPGEKVVLARRKGDQWYLGGLNGLDEAKTTAVNVDFLEKGTYWVQFIKDGADE